MNADPYVTPDAISAGGGGPNPQYMVSAAAVQQLATTKPWVRFISVMAFIGAGFLLLAAAGMFIASFAVGSSVMSKASQGNPAFGAIGGFVGLAAIYAVLAFVYIFPALKLWKYANAIGNLLLTGREEDLIAALNQQRSFWKFVGIMIIVMLVVYLIAVIAIAVTVGVTAASHAR